MKDWYYKDEGNNVALQHFCLHFDPLHRQQQISLEVPCLQIAVDLDKKIGAYQSASDVYYTTGMRFLCLLLSFS